MANELSVEPEAAGKGGGVGEGADARVWVGYARPGNNYCRKKMFVLRKMYMYRAYVEKDVHILDV